MAVIMKLLTILTQQQGFTKVSLEFGHKFGSKKLKLRPKTDSLQQVLETSRGGKIHYELRINLNNLTY